MKLNQPVLLGLLMGVLGTARAAAWTGPLSNPAFAAPKDCPKAVMDQVSAALNRREAKFPGGRFFGAFDHSMRFGGDTGALNAMLADLAASPGMILSIRFSAKFTELAGWTVSNSYGGTNFAFRVQVNLKSERLKLDELVIPAMTGPPIALVPGQSLPEADALPSITPETEGREP